MKKKCAFTMIEILMIAIVMGTALLGILTVMKKMEQSNTKVAENVIATNLAVQGYELFRAQENDIRYDNLLSLFSESDANSLIRTTSRVHWLQEGVYYVVYAAQKTGLTYSGDDLIAGLESEEGDGYKQLRVILGATCSTGILGYSGKCLSGDQFFNTYPGITQWSGICLQGDSRIPCTGGGQFFREIIVTKDVNRCGFGTGTFGESGLNIACEGTGENTIYRYRYGYNVCSRVFYNWQAGGQSRKKQVAEICAKLN